MRVNIDQSLNDAGAAELARAIKAGAFSVVEVVAAHIERIGQVNPQLNAVVIPMFESARREAEAADELIARDGTENLPPLFGVPVTVKDCWPVEGEGFTGGSWFHRNDIAESDATVVTRLREAGAIILGKTNLPDMCWGFESVNPVFGRTSNARSSRHSAGGSSGGEGAIITAGGSALGIGSDIGGSVRNPAAINGCVSLKPSAGRLPTTGHVPEVAEALRGWNVAGPLARRVEDLRLALSVLGDKPVGPTPAISGLKCTTYIRNGLFPVKRIIAETVLMAAGALEAAGMDVQRDDSLPIDRLGFVYNYLLNECGSGIREGLGGGEGYSTIREFARGVIGKAHISREALAVESYIRLGGPLGRLRGDCSFERLEQYKAQLYEAIGDGVLLLPLLLTKPPKHGGTWAPLSQIPYATPFNATGMPAAIVPVRWTNDGLPLAVQVAAREGGDELVLAVALELERAFGGWRPV